MMSEPVIPISDTALRQLRELAEWSGRPLLETLEQVIKEQYDRQFWAAVDAGYAALRADPVAWEKELVERRAWEATLMDGLDPAEHWTEDGVVVEPNSGNQRHE